MIFHITTKNDWEKAQIDNEYIAESLASEGFIHCSTIKQTIDTANNIFEEQRDLILLCSDESKVNVKIKFEEPNSKNHDPEVRNLFPHIYGPLNTNAVIEVIDFPCNNDGTFSLPEEIKKY